jgi:hypothetical protein
VAPTIDKSTLWSKLRKIEALHADEDDTVNDEDYGKASQSDSITGVFPKD